MVISSVIVRLIPIESTAEETLQPAARFVQSSLENKPLLVTSFDSETTDAVRVSRAIMFDMTTLAASNAHSSEYFAFVLAMAIALVLTAAHRRGEKVLPRGSDNRQELDSMAPGCQNDVKTTITV
ncbi:hypothetical protein PoB_004433300 [Plakobranchus ocellatus]|uniref:Uncharacterized protein n=1 Tax=Plakobranchus ocellatus TaxID=259542 RepID=A0AAV4BE32_9GAST|nr:hypothetical protein PoB_004433300 [Plakobranchus ocellatus]